MPRKPLVIDLFCGVGGWTKGFLAEGYEAVGFDLERHQYGDKSYPAQLVLQDVRALHGSQFREAACIVASPPCQAYSYRAMPWRRAKALPPPSNELFDVCFRLQREASEAARRYIPLVVENVKGAQRWVGSARWHFGSYYLWGDVPPLMPITRHAKNGNGSSWFAIAHGKDNGQTYGTNPVRGPGIDGVKQGGSCAEWFDEPLAERRKDATKQIKMGKGSRYGPHDPSAYNSRSDSRKAASALIAEIPFDLAQWIARVFKP